MMFNFITTQFFIRKILIVTYSILGLLSFTSSALAEVSNVDISSRELIANGQSFGETGAYEKLVGRVYFEIDPDNAHNQIIADIALASRNNAGMVEMSADIEILSPVNLEDGNGIALIDIVNRGRKIALSFNQPSAGNEYGDGFLMEQGYSIVWIGWEFDINSGVRIEVPSVNGIANSELGGLGYAAVRDTASWMKYDSKAVVSAESAIAFGLSQSGRYLRNYLYLGFNSDESNRKVFDGMMPHISGSSRIDLNRRGSNPASQGQYTATSYPFTDEAYLDSVSGAEEGMLENVRSSENQPFIFYTNTSVEYWGGGRVAALVHSTPDGSADIELAENVRFYFLAGTQHGPGAFPPTVPSTGQEMNNPMNYWWNLRALLTGMTAWIVNDIEPPKSAHPSFDAGNLVTPESIYFPDLAGVHDPRGVTAGTRVANPLLVNNGGSGAALALLVPQVNLDGNEISGIRHPALSVPLATYTGWNFTNPNAGDPDQLFPLAGSYIPFASTREERIRLNDPRLSIAERYESKIDYIAKMQGAGLEQINQGYLLEADLTPILQRASEHWDLLQDRAR